MTLSILKGLGIPPAGLVERFWTPTRAVVLTWRAVARDRPIVITSWWRDQGRNLATGGDPYSQHLVGTAMDGSSPGMSRAQLLPIVQRAAELYGAAVPTKASETSGTTVHVQGLPVGTVRALLTAQPRAIAIARSFVGPSRPILQPPQPWDERYPPWFKPSPGGRPGGGFNR